MNTHVTEANLNEFGRFDDQKATVDQQKAKTYFDGLEGKELPLFRVNIRTAKHLQDFIIQGGCYPTEPYRCTVNRWGIAKLSVRGRIFSAFMNWVFRSIMTDFRVCQEGPVGSTKRVAMNWCPTIWSA